MRKLSFIIIMPFKKKIIIFYVIKETKFILLTWHRIVKVSLLVFSQMLVNTFTFVCVCVVFSYGIYFSCFVSV